MINNIPNIEIFRLLNQEVAGHINAKKHLISLLSRSQLRHYQHHVLGIPNHECIEPGKLLLIGASGTGKTFLVQSLQKLINFPLLYIDATKLNPTGASGGIKSDNLVQMINDHAAKLHQEARLTYPTLGGTIDRMIVFVDEIDKLGTEWTNCKWNTQVQANFLTIFENKNTNRGVSFIFAGAFTELYKQKNKDTNKNTVGFFTPKEKEAVKEITDTDLVDHGGLIPELVGRIHTIVELDQFTPDDYYKILNEKLIPKKQKDLKTFNIDIVVDVDESVKKEMCEKASKSGQGVRALQRELNKLFVEHEFNYENICAGLDNENML